MADIVSPAVRSRMMSGIKGKDTKPELILRKELHCRGFRYRLHNRDLPGRPDMMFRKYRAVVFAHGCLWHRHECHLFMWPCVDNPPKAKFWAEKINGNYERDQLQLAALYAAEWRVAVVWECALKGRLKLPVGYLVDQLAGWLESTDRKIEIAGM